MAKTPFIDREVKKLAEAEAQRLGLDVSFEIGRKHTIMVVRGNGQKREIALAISPRSSHQRNWVRQDLRRFAREFGLAAA